MARLLCYYGTSEGQTERIATRIADRVRERGHDADLVYGTSIPDDFSMQECDAAVIGASIHAGAHQQYVERFVIQHLDALETIPSAFFSVSLSAADPSAERRKTAESYVEEFLDSTGWSPNLTATVPGALRYSRYGILKRFLLTQIAKRGGLETDASRDYEYTDWDDVEAFADRVSALVE